MTTCPAVPRRGTLSAIGGWAARRRGMVLGAWVVLLLAASVGHGAVHSTYSDSLSIPGSNAQNGLDVLRAGDPKAGGQGGQLVFSDGERELRTEAAAIAEACAAVGRLPHVLAVSDPLSPATVAPGGHVAYASVNFSANPQSLGHKYVASVTRALDPATAAGVQVAYGGALGQADTPKGGDSRSELIGVVVALLVLLVGFGSVFAALLPLAGAIIGVITALGLVGVVAAAVSLGTDAPTLATMMGLGVGIDYALFITTRHRQLLLDGGDPIESVRATMAASGPSVVLAAGTVAIAMLGLYASGITFIGNLGLAATVAVAVAALAALTLVPALLGFARGAIDRFHVRRPVAEPSGDRSPLHAYARMVARHPWRFAFGGIILLLVLASPALSMRLGHVGPGSEPRSYSERRAYDAISAGFGPGANGPLTIVIELRHIATPAQASALGSLVRTRLESSADVSSVAALQARDGGSLLVGRVIPASGPEAPATATLVEHLQQAVLPSALRPSGASGYVTGSTAATADFTRSVSSRLPLIVGVVVAAAFVLLLCAFRSPVVALKAALLNLLSIGSALGILVAAFQWGWATSLLGLPGPVPIESYVPMIVFAIVFGLSMDYEVFLVSRIREHWLDGMSNSDSVATGLAQTARVISCAALILACVFFAFLLSTKVTIKMLALGLGASIVIDATVIRLVVVPALMLLLDRANWWTPGWLGRVRRSEPVPGS